MVALLMIKWNCMLHCVVVCNCCCCFSCWVYSKQLDGTLGSNEHVQSSSYKDGELWIKYVGIRLVGVGEAAAEEELRNDYEAAKMT